MYLSIIIIIILITILISLIYYYTYTYAYTNKSKKILYTDFNYFYNTNHIDLKFLDNINKFSNNIYNETMNINSNWIDWPEKQLYNNNNKDSWKIFPFYGFDKWIDKNCKRCPTIYNFIKTIPNLKLATLSKLSSKTKLNPHRGWGSHSNFVLRCHYGIIVPDKCYVSVSNNIKPPLHDNDNDNDNDNDDNDIISKTYPDDYIYKYSNGIIEEIQFHKQFKWTIFDDSETHYAGNLSNTDRIVLIIDITRPKSIKNGTSEIGHSSELLQLIDYYKKNY